MTPVPSTVAVCLDLGLAFAAQSRYFDAIPFISRICPGLLDQLLYICFDYHEHYSALNKKEHDELFDDIFSQVFDVVHMEVSSSSLNAIAQRTIEGQLYSETFYVVVMDIINNVFQGFHSLGPYFAGVDLTKGFVQQQPYIFFHAKQSTSPSSLYIPKC